MEGAEGFMLMYSHLQSFGIRVVLSFNCLSNLGLECIGWVCGGRVEVVVKYEILYFGLIRRCIQKSQDNAHNTQVAFCSRVFR